MIKQTRKNKEEHSTDELMRMIEASPKQFEKQKLNGISDKNFSSYLRDLMEDYHCTAAQLIARTYLSKTFFYQILSGSRMPGRDTILKTALALGLTVDETQRLLTLGGRNALYPKVRRDAAILCAIRQNRRLDEVNQMLEELGEPVLS